MPKKRFETVLSSLGVATSEQITHCQKAIAGTGRSLAQCLIDEGIATPDVIAKAYAEYADIQHIERIEDKMADPGLLARVPLRFFRENVVLPIMLNGQKTVLTANPIDLQPLDELKLLLGDDLV